MLLNHKVVNTALGESDPTKDPQLKLDYDDDKPVQQITEGGIKFWRFVNRTGGFKSKPGKTNYTSRLSIFIKDSQEKEPIIGVKKAQQAEYLVNGKDFRNFEFTTIQKPVDIIEKEETFSHKPCGYVHDEEPKEKTLCVTCNVPYFETNKELFGTEFTHNDYHWHNPQMVGEFPKTGENWLGMKTVKYNINDNKGARF